MHKIRARSAKRYASQNSKTLDFYQNGVLYVQNDTINTELAQKSSVLKSSKFFDEFAWQFAVLRLCSLKKIAAKIVLSDFSCPVVHIFFDAYIVGAQREYVALFFFVG